MNTKPRWQFYFDYGWRMVFGIAYNNFKEWHLNHRSVAIWFGPFSISVWHESWDLEKEAQ